MSKKLINILWTGGWDSTFRMIELSRLDIIIQPIYMYGDGRTSEYNERLAMSKIMKMLKCRKDTKAKILNVKFVDIRKLKKDKNITNAYNKIKSETHLGSQYEWLAIYTNTMKFLLPKIAVIRNKIDRKFKNNNKYRKYVEYLRTNKRKSN